MATSTIAAQGPGPFEYFKEFPLEIQQHIWELAAAGEPDRGPRIIRITSKYPCGKLHIINQRHKVPVLLRISHTTRTTALRYYEAWDNESGGKIFVHRSHDIFYLGESDLLSFWFESAIGELIAMGAMGVTSYAEGGLATTILKDSFKGVRKLAFDLEFVNGKLKRNWRLWLRTFKDMVLLTVVQNLCPSSIPDLVFLGEEDVKALRRFCPMLPKDPFADVEERTMGFQVSIVRNVYAVPRRHKKTTYAFLGGRSGFRRLESYDSQGSNEAVFAGVGGCG